MSTWICRSIDQIEDIEKIVDLEIAVWGLPPRDAVPSSLLHAMTANGSLVVGAYAGEEVIGMAFAFLVVQGKKQLLWSHMAGVHPDYQGKGVGFDLKQFQRQWALEHKIDTIAWTFDPLQRGNANFNLHVLGAAAQIYHVNFYGEMQDGINAGLPSDRLEVHWRLKEKQVAQRALGRIPNPSWKSTPQFLLRRCEDSTPEISNLDALNKSHYLVEIPGDLKTLKQTTAQLALDWRIALRHTLQTAFSQGYKLTDFVVIGGRHCYVLTAAQSWYLYVMECADQSLYTGITPDIKRRLKQHNAGRGAAYTASRLPIKGVALWQFPDRTSAAKAEIAFKKLSRPQKLEFISQKKAFRDRPFVEFDHVVHPNFG